MSNFFFERNLSSPFLLILRIVELFKKIILPLKKHHPPFGSPHFWVIQFLVIGIAAIHDVIEVGGHLPQLGLLYFIPVSLFFVPVVYAALYFGFVGSLATAIWIIIITIPNWVFWHHGLERFGVIFQMIILVAVAVFVGQRVDRESSARHQAETASSALKTYAAHIVKAQEEERTRIARELHDETVQTISLLYRNIGSFLESYPLLPEAAVNKLKQIQNVAGQTVKDLRDFTLTLRPTIIDDLGIVASLYRLSIDFEDRTGIKSRFNLIGKDRRLPQEIEIAIFRIAQEAIRNVELHSKATEVELTITISEDSARLDIHDNGIGFSSTTALSIFPATGRLGLLGMQERVEIIDGKLIVDSNQEKGTTISVFIPFS